MKSVAAQADARAEAQRAARAEAQREAQREAQHRRRLADVFGDVLPEQASLDRDDESAAAAREAELRRDVPPHHGD